MHILDSTVDADGFSARAKLRPDIPTWKDTVTGQGQVQKARCLAAFHGSDLSLFCEMLSEQSSPRFR